ncbi:MAG: O-antigen ligase family protein [Pirellulales bacterium]|nr:O-antigen ligase family protein [Pirellulales bacterium]
MATHAPSHSQSGRSVHLDPQVRGRSSLGEQVGVLSLQAVDAGLGAVVFIVPFLLGGRIALGQLVLVALSLWVAVCWCVHQCCTARPTWVRSPVTLLVVAALGLVGLQLVPVPATLLNALSPHLYESLPLWAPDSGEATTFGVWNTVSLAPTATCEAFILLSAFALLLLTTVQRVRRIEDVERLLYWIVVSTLAMAAFALAQFVTSDAADGKFFWFFEHPFTDTKGLVKGSFTNANHFAQFVALGLGPLIWWTFGRQLGSRAGRSAPQSRFGREGHSLDVKLALKAIALACCVFIGLMSLSRGGAMAIFAAAVVCVFIVNRASPLGRRMLFALVGVGLFVTACLFVHGYDALVDELDDFGSLEELDKNAGRRGLWQVVLAGVAEYPLLGTGLGSHCEVFPMYARDVKTIPPGIEYTHAENGYVQVALEMGVPGLLLVLTAIGLCAYWCMASIRRGSAPRTTVCFAAISASLAASVVHSIGDFIWYVPGCMIVPVILGACACRLWQLDRANRDGPEASTRLFDIPRFGWLVLAVCVILVGFPMVQSRLAAARAEPAWYRFLLLNGDSWKLNGASRRRALESMAGELSQVIRWQPDHARAHARLASVHFELFDAHGDDPDALSMDEIRHDVLTSYDPRLETPFRSSADAKRWLSMALGQRCRHLEASLQSADRALRLCPLLGEAYLPLVVFAFLEGPQRELPIRADYVRQALKVRPVDGDVLFSAGVVAMDPVRALEEEAQALQDARWNGELDETAYQHALQQFQARVEREAPRLKKAQESAVAYWRASFHCGRGCQKRLVRCLADKVPVPELLSIFQPDLAGLRVMEDHFCVIKRPDKLRLLRVRMAEVAEHHAGDLQGGNAAPVWLEAANAYWYTDQREKSLRCFHNALRCDPNYYRAHLALGQRLLELEQFGEAERHFNWCQQRTPHDEDLRRQLNQAVDGRLRLSSRPVSGPQNLGRPLH